MKAVVADRNILILPEQVSHLVFLSFLSSQDLGLGVEPEEQRLEDMYQTFHWQYLESNNQKLRLSKESLS